MIMIHNHCNKLLCHDYILQSDSHTSLDAGIEKKLVLTRDLTCCELANGNSSFCKCFEL